jgi:hypothetical protein
VCVFVLVLGVCLAASAGAALADSLNTPTIVGGAPQAQKPMQFSFTGSAAAGGTELLALARPAATVGCQPTFADDQAAVQGSVQIFNGNYTLGPGAFTAAATSFSPGEPGSWLLCVWLAAPNPAPAYGVTTTAGPASLNFTVAPPPPPPPSAHQFNGSGVHSRVAVGVDPAGERFMFWQSADQRLWESYYVSSGPGTSMIANAGQIYSAPAVAVHQNGEQDVFWKGGDGSLWETWWTHTTGNWSAALDLKTPQLTSDPTAGVDSAGHEWVFWRGARNSLWGIRYSGSAWGRPFRVKGAGSLTSGPGVAVSPHGSVVVFYRGSNQGLWAETLTGERWVRSDLGDGHLGSAPTAGADGAGNLYVFWRGRDGGLWEATRLSGKWSTGAELTFAGSLGTPPGATVEANGAQHVFWGGTDHNLWGIEYQNGHW